MLNLGPTNCDSDSPDVILESTSEDDEIDISQFVESVLEEPEAPTPSSHPPPMVFFPIHNALKLQQGFNPGRNQSAFSQAPQQLLTLNSGLRQVQSTSVPIQGSSGKSLLISKNLRVVPLPNTELPSISWLRDCFDKVKHSCASFRNQVTSLEDRLRGITSTSDTKKILSFSNDLQSLLKQSEQGYKYLASQLSSDHQAWAMKTSQRRLALNMTSNGNQDVTVKREILLPVSGESNIIPLKRNERLSLPPNMLISVNKNNHSLSITTVENNVDEKNISELCAKFNIKPCYILLERCDETKEDNDDIEIIEELIAL